MARKSQNARVLKTLETAGSITTSQARARGIQNLRARISELRETGVKIETVATKPGNPKYVLA